MFTLNCLFTLGLAAVLTFSEDFTADGSILVSSSEKSEIVNKHNDLRRSVQPTASNMLEMSWNSEAAANAQRWADRCTMTYSSADFRKISNNACGENVFMSSRPNMWSYAIQTWYDLGKSWRYGVESVNVPGLGQFIQIIWASSNQVGCAMAHCPGSQMAYFYVCHYCPGNIMTPYWGEEQIQRPYKSGPSCGDCPNACNNKLCTNPGPSAR